ncbi:MAG: glycosyltransferase [Planctomycetes bacterium]|nr:glycosyltransferase [Planctomycetota bacterium]
MRIVFVLHQFFPRHHTGTEQYARALAHEARRRGHEIVIFTYEPEFARTAAARIIADDEFEGISVRRVAMARVLDANPVLAEFDAPVVDVWFRQLLDEFRPDQIQIFHSLSVGEGALAESVARGIPTIAHATDFFTVCPIATLTLPDGTPCEGPPDGGFGCFGCIHTGVMQQINDERLSTELRALHRLTETLHSHRPLLGALALAHAGRAERLAAGLSRASAVAAPSRFLQNALASRGVAADKLSYVPYGLDLSRLANLKDKRSPPVVFGYFGTIAPHKGVLPLVKAFIKSRADARLVVRGRIGEFPQYGEEVLNLIKTDPRIEAQPPFPPDQLGAAFSAIEALIVPSIWHENTPFVALEALAAKRPVLASDRGGLAEIVGEGRGGALFPAGDVDAMSAAITRFSDPAAIRAASAGIQSPRGIAEAWNDLQRLAPCR